MRSEQMTPDEMQAAIEKLQAAMGMSTQVNLEVYYFWAPGIMILIHAGFMMYEWAHPASNTLWHQGQKTSWPSPSLFRHFIFSDGGFIWPCLMALSLISKRVLVASPGGTRWGRTCRITPPVFSGPHLRCFHVPRHQLCQAL